MDSCIFSYYISENANNVIEGLTNRHKFGKYTVYTDSKTPYVSACNESCECAIFGLAINVFTGENRDLAKEMVADCSDIEDIVSLEKKLGGKYIIFYRKNEEYYIIADATCSIPIFYTTSGEFSSASNYRYLVDRYGYFVDQEFQKIRDSGSISQAMPYDITQYREIKQLIPNHYLSVNIKRAVRFVNASCIQSVIAVEEASNIVTPMIEKICDYYKSLFKIYCPITAGRDSRVVLAFLAGKDSSVQCYTIRHPEHHNNTQDIVIPKYLCSENNIPYEQIRDIKISEHLKKEIDALLGEKQYSFRSLQIARTIQEHYGDGAIINGDIIGQVGKCSLHRDIPLLFATPNYFRCKLHNYSREAKKKLILWLEEIKKSGEYVNPFDLFSVENRLGRWAGQTNLIYNSIGQNYLNIFNSRSIIYTWTATDRKERKKSCIHTFLIKKKMPSLLDTPFQKDRNIIVKLSKVNGVTYLIASYIKYYVEKIKFNMKIK